MWTKEKYDAVSHQELYMLIELVNESLEEGWVCHGNLIYADGMFIQPMLSTAINEPSEDVERPKNENIRWAKP